MGIGEKLEYFLLLWYIKALIYQAKLVLKVYVKLKRLILILDTTGNSKKLFFLNQF